MFTFYRVHFLYVHFLYFHFLYGSFFIRFTFYFCFKKPCNTFPFKHFLGLIILYTLLFHYLTHAARYLTHAAHYLTHVAHYLTHVAHYLTQ